MLLYSFILCYIDPSQHIANGLVKNVIESQKESVGKGGRNMTRLESAGLEATLHFVVDKADDSVYRPGSERKGRRNRLEGKL